MSELARENGESSQQPIGVSIGRLIADELLDDFRAAVDYVMGDENVAFRARDENIGVHYARLHLADLGEPPKDELQIAPRMQAIVASLCGDEGLNEATALQPVAVRILSIEFKDRESTSLQINLADPVDEYYPEGRLLKGEQLALARRLVATKRADHLYTKLRSSRVRIGKVVEGRQAFTNPRLKEIRELLGSQATLQRVGPVTLPRRSS